MKTYSYKWKDVLEEYTCQTFFFMSMMKREQDETVKANQSNNTSRTINGEFIGS